VKSFRKPTASPLLAVCDVSVVHGAELNAADQRHLTLRNVSTCWQLKISFPLARLYSRHESYLQRVTTSHLFAGPEWNAISHHTTRHHTQPSHPRDIKTTPDSPSRRCQRALREKETPTTFRNVQIKCSQFLPLSIPHIPCAVLFLHSNNVLSEPGLDRTKKQSCKDQS